MQAETSRPAELPDRARRRLLTRRLTRRSASLTALGTVIPGAGLLGTRYARIGRIVLALLVLGTIATIFVVVLKGPTATALALAVRPGALVTLAVGLFIGTLVWLTTIVLTHRGTLDPSLDRAQRSGLRVLTAVLCLLVIVPMGTAMRYSLIQRDLVDALFTDEDGVVLEAAKPLLSQSDPWENTDRVTVLLLGSDAGSDRIGVRTDSMIVATIDTHTGEAVLLSLPRNLQNVPFPADNPLSKLWPKGFNCPDCLLNAVWTAATDNAALFKGVANPGLTTVRGVIAQVLGLPIDYTVIVDLKGFQSLVDAMGGVTVRVTERLPIEGYHLPNGAIAGVEGWIEPGVQTLDGYHALWFARSRLISDDYSRMRRQRCLVGKIIEQVNPSLVLQRYPQFAQVAKDNVQTDIPAADLPAWVELVTRVKDGSIRSLTFTESNINPAKPDFAAIRRMVQTAIAPLPTADQTTTASTPAAPTPGKTSTSGKLPTTTATTPTPDTVVDIEAAC